MKDAAFVRAAGCHTPARQINERFADAMTAGPVDMDWAVTAARRAGARCQRRQPRFRDRFAK
jgi:hypothetical protein